jgi:hypothetical protein
MQMKKPSLSPLFSHFTPFFLRTETYYLSPSCITLFFRFSSIQYCHSKPKLSSLYRRRSMHSHLIKGDKRGLFSLQRFPLNKEPVPTCREGAAEGGGVVFPELCLMTIPRQYMFVIPFPMN